LFGIFGKQFQALVDSVLEPVWSWVIARSWAFRASLILIVSIAVGGWQRPDLVQDLFERARFAYRVETSDSQTIPLSERTEARLSRTLGRLGDVIENDLLPESRQNMTAWSASQTLVAGQSLGKEPEDPDALVEFIRRARVSSCFCWTELPIDRQHAPGLHISGWVITALAGMNRGLEPDELSSLLALQSADGSWTIFAGAEPNSWASTYATAWMTLGLHRQLKADLVTPSQKSRVKGSVRRGTAWLLQKRENGRWRPYPNRASSIPSNSISGLVLHVLHQVGAPELVAIDRQWLQQLPDEVVEASSKESPYVEVPTSAGTQFDHFQQLEAPWMLAATADAYQAGNGVEKRRALTWVERSLSRASFDNADSQPDNWWRAELAIGLAHLERVRLGTATSRR